MPMAKARFTDYRRKRDVTETGEPTDGELGRAAIGSSCTSIMRRRTTTTCGSNSTGCRQLGLIDEANIDELADVSMNCLDV